MGDVQVASRSPRWRGWWWKLLVAAVLVLVALHGGYRVWLSHQVNRELARIRAEGFPTTLAELNAWYPRPAGANAADGYAQVFAKDRAPGDATPDPGALPGRPDWPAVGQPPSPQLLAAMEACVAPYRELLRLFHEAGQIPECRYPTDLSRGVQDDISYLGHLRSAARFAGLQGRLHAEHGNGAGACESILDILHAADSLRNEPVMISHLVRISLAWQASDELEAVLARIPLRDEDLARLSAAFGSQRNPQPLPRVLIGERAFGLGAFDLFARPSAAGAIPPGAPPSLLWKASGVFDLDRLTYLRIMRERIDEAQGRPAAAPTPLPRYCVMSAMIIPALSAVRDTDRSADGRNQRAVVALAVKRYQLAQGTLPARLDNLVPQYLSAVPTDPKDGQPLRYKLTATGAILYHLGKDGIDHGGVCAAANGRPHAPGTDEVFEIVR